MKPLTLIVCDVQPDVLKKIENPSRFSGLIEVAIQAARKSRTVGHVRLIHTLLQFPDACYDSIPRTHPKLGILRKLKATNSQINWFTSSDLCVPAEDNETVVSRKTFLPQATDRDLLNAFQNSTGLEDQEFVVIGYRPTVQAVCYLLGDIIGAPNVRILRECVAEENSERCQSYLEHGLLFREDVVSLVDFLESMDLLHEEIESISLSKSSTQKYVCDCERGGHLSLYMFYLLRDYGYIKWPVQPWFQDITKQGKQYWCPLGRRTVDLCDEPKFSSLTRFFLKGREWLDEKNLLFTLVPELMPPTFHSLADAKTYSAALEGNDGITKLIWFLKKVNQNGGRAVDVLHQLPSRQLESDEQLQVHVPNPLLFPASSKIVDGEQTSLLHKCHVKTYQWVGCCHDHTTKQVLWKVYMYNIYYLATADKPFDPMDLSDQVQITTMRRYRLYKDTPWRVKWDLTRKCETNMRLIIQRAVEGGKLQCPSRPSTTANDSTALQFEVLSADWMLDEDGNMFLIEVNGTPVLYDPVISQPLITRGLKLYDGLYKENPKDAVVNDTDLLQGAVSLALKGTLPKSSLWKPVTSIPALTDSAKRE